MRPSVSEVVVLPPAIETSPSTSSTASGSVMANAPPFSVPNVPATSSSSPPRSSSAPAPSTVTLPVTATWPLVNVRPAEAPCTNKSPFTVKPLRALTVPVTCVLGSDAASIVAPAPLRINVPKLLMVAFGDVRLPATVSWPSLTPSTAPAPSVRSATATVALMSGENGVNARMKTFSVGPGTVPALQLPATPHDVPTVPSHSLSVPGGAASTQLITAPPGSSSNAEPSAGVAPTMLMVRVLASARLSFALT